MPRLVAGDDIGSIINTFARPFFLNCHPCFGTGSGAMVKKQLLLLNNSPTEGSPGEIKERFPPVKQHKIARQHDGSDPFLDFCSSI